MICPTCGSNVSNDKSVCPLCGTELSSTQAIPRMQGTWCKSCGALIPADASVCPKCMRPTHPEEKPAERKTRNLDLPDIDIASEEVQSRAAVSSLSKAKDIAQFESAIPSYNEIEMGTKRDGAPRTRTILVAAVASILLIGGAVVLITHPWDPDRYQTRTEVGADMSSVGNMEHIGTLQGQDVKSRDTENSVAGTIQEAYKQLGDLKQRLEESEKTFDETCLSPDYYTRTEGANEVELLAIDLSNLIAHIGQVGGSNSEFAEDIDHIVTLGNWLRNRVDALRAAWDLSVSTENPEDKADEITGYLAATGSSEYIRLFESHYGEWAPAAP